MTSRLKPLAAVLLAGLVVCLGAAPPGVAAYPPLPLTVPARDWRPLSDRWDPALQQKLTAALRRHPLWQSLLDQGRMAVGLVDLADARRPRFAKVNGSIMMYAASLPKLAILLAAYQGFADGTLKETPEVRRDLIEMIRRSSNVAAAQMVARLGLFRINRVILDPRYHFYDPRRGGGLWLGSGYCRGGPENPEPVTGLLHTANVNQLCRFYYLLTYGRLVSPAASWQILKILAFPDILDKFVVYLKRSMPLGSLYRKSGEYGLSHLDSILVWGKGWRRYILVALVEDRQGEQILKELVPVVERVLRSSRPRTPEPARP